MENGSDTPDYILANYLIDSLEAFDRACVDRSHWYCGPPVDLNYWTEDNDPVE